MRLFSSLALALSLILSLISPSFGHAHQGKRHHVHRPGDLARRDPGEITLHKRFENARLTFFADGLGACGATNLPTDFIVALNSDQFDSGNYCFQMITITVNGMTTQAQITDRCPGCPYGGLDCSQGLFGFFADISVGVLYGSWDFSSGGSSPSPQSSSTPYSPPTSTVETPSTTSTPLPTPTSLPPTISSSSASSQSSGSTSVSSNSTTMGPTQTSSIVSTTTGAVPGGTNSSVLLGINLSAVYIGQLLAACRGSQ